VIIKNGKIEIKIIEIRKKDVENRMSRYYIVRNRKIQ
jgi:hypothetical protein